MYLNLFLRLVIIILLLYIIIKNKETFTENNYFKFHDTQNNSEFVIAEIININTFYNMTVNLYKEIEFKMFEFNKNSILRLNIRPNDYNKITTLGFYISMKNNSNNYVNALKIKNDDDEIIINLSIINKDIYLESPKVEKQGIYLQNNSDFKIDELNFIIIQIDNNNQRVEVNINNINKQRIGPFNSNINLTSKQIEFGPNFEGDIGNILIFHDKINEDILCHHFICENYRLITEPAVTDPMVTDPMVTDPMVTDPMVTEQLVNKRCDFKLKTADMALISDSINPLNKCIEECYKKDCDIKYCQKICIDCQDIGYLGEKMTLEEKKKLCPWYKDIKLLNRSPPSAPKIRGFPKENGDIIIEWKKPYDGRIAITHYIIEINNTINNDTNVIWTNSNCNICEHTIKDLENHIYYNISVRAVNSDKQGGGIGPKSNVITISPSSKNKLFKNIFDEFNYNNINNINNTNNNIRNCNNSLNSDHILDTLNPDDIDIYKYVTENN